MPLNQVISILSPDDVILDLGLTDANYPEVERQINAASARIEVFLDKPVKARDVVLRFDGTGDPILDVGRIVNIQTLSILSHQAGVADTNISASDYLFDQPGGRIFYRGGFPRGFQNIQLIARLGFDPVPDDIKEACLALIRFWRGTGLGGDLKSERIGDYEYTRFTPASLTPGLVLGSGDAAPDLPQDIQAMLASHRRWGWGT